MPSEYLDFLTPSYQSVLEYELDYTATVGMGISVNDNLKKIVINIFPYLAFCINTFDCMECIHSTMSLFINAMAAVLGMLAVGALLFSYKEGGMGGGSENRSYGFYLNSNEHLSVNSLLSFERGELELNR